MNKFDSTVLKQDEEFKNGLQIIRGYLMNLTSPHAARCCGEWLQKLRNSSDERELRNVLLKRLTCQVQTRNLQYPFDRLPPDRSLYKIYENAENSPWSTEYESSIQATTISSVAEELGCGDMDRQREEIQWYDLPASSNTKADVPITTAPIPTQTNCFVKTADRIQQVDNERKVDSKDKTNQCEIEINAKCFKSHKQHTDSAFKASKKEDLSIYLEDYKNLLIDYKREVNDSITELADRLECAIESNQVQKSDLKHLQASLQESWTSKLESLEHELVGELSKLECQLETDRSKYEIKIEQLKNVIQEKDEKIISLDSRIKQQSINLKQKMSSVKNEISTVAKENDMYYKKKYANLKKQLMDLENINQELMKQYQQNIVLSVKDFESKMNSAKLMASNQSMVEMEEKIKQLEHVYQKIFHEYKKKMEGENNKELKKMCQIEELNKFNKNT